ncbi:sensor domain-containing protein [Mycobacterium intracellulare]|uniref:non-specific serine/threonine protein kinase n=1 Tax=Mycobacterium intracellulare TaxID=1767 RepID=A0AAE4RI85_MYCIT|nr:sensor domain-containing protein [Mycobacterium intracellulare]MDV6979120.1 sensor domain-containing protein [Mycobacterium intracellulare]MDV6984528.1 sensor domain-containing protein [Mycobacterium intracellulare]MDV7014574.1 sensor domain-containing protein [Mycobacterium intracellulare]MDV7029490.1 sensor domain-containing protein [Mycobacterium intracellulare]
MLGGGSVVCDYRIRRVLGTGGMGAVYLAADPALPRDVALKVLSAELSRDPDFRARFIREADTAAGLEHPQIVSVYNRGETEDGQLWIAMQFVDGIDADAALRAGEMTPQRAVHIITEVAKALDFAHAHKVVHRDVKPANFLLSGPVGVEEHVLLGDFGIARALDDAGLTATGSVLATVAYAAPEVLSNAPIDGRVDIYSLGCTLYRLLTGHTPFPATNGAAGVMAAHLFSPPPRVTDTLPSLPRGLDQVIAVAMAKDPLARFVSAGALARAAKDALHESVGFPPLPPVPSAEVSSYPTTTPGPAWWQHSGPRTMAAPQGQPLQTVLPPGPPAPPRRRRRGIVIGASLGALAVVASAVTITVWPNDTAPGPSEPSAASTPAPRTAAPTVTGAPATDISAAQLPAILLSANELNSAAGGDPMVLEADGATLLDDSATVDNPQCLGAWTPAQNAVYRNAGDSGVAVQQLRALNQSWHDGLTQAAISFASQDNAARSWVTQRGQWAVCGGKSLSVTKPGAPPETWDFAQPITTSGVLTIAASQRGGTANCQHGILVRGNVMIDLRQCRPTGQANVAALVSATAQHVPQQ